MSLTRTKLLSPSRRIESVTLEDGSTVHLRRLNEAELAGYESSLFDKDGKVTSETIHGQRRRLLCLSLCESNGDRLFADDESELLGSIDAIDAATLHEAAKALSIREEKRESVNAKKKRIRQSYRIRFAFRVCLALGIDDPIHWMNNVDRSVLDWWIAYYRVEPFGSDWSQTATIAERLGHIADTMDSYFGGEVTPRRFNDYLPADSFPAKPNRKQSTSIDEALTRRFKPIA